VATKKNAVSQYLSEIGRKGGQKGGLSKVPKGTAVLSAEERTARASEAVTARWEEYYRQYPEKLEEKKRRDAAKAAAAKRKARKAGKAK
jgi:hypothetical protein